MHRMMLIPTLVLAVTISATAQAFASTGPVWRVQPTPTPAGAKSPGLVGVSCASTTACTAVGRYFTSNVGVTLAERWNGTNWRIESTPVVVGARENDLNAVSCPSTSRCTAVGGSIVGGNGAELVEYWNGSGWAIQPTPSTYHADLLGVSCPSTTTCTAVGDYINASVVVVTLAERWNGNGWTVQPTSNPGGGSDVLQGVSCPSTTVCTAVGSYSSSSGASVTLAERWNGSTWSVQSTPNPAGAARSVLVAVSCSSSTACTAVGDYPSPAGAGALVAFAERWDGATWAIESTPSPAGAKSNALQGVSCPSTSSCTAVGSFENSSGVRQTLALQWNGTSWVLQSTPNPPGGVSVVLYGLACPSATVCGAVGTYKNEEHVRVTLAERYS
jgi:hypothetical protein